MQGPKNPRRLVLAGAVTVITIAGSLYGAGLKTNQEVAQTVQKSRQITIEERIASLRENRQVLTSKKEHVEKQIRELDMRIEDRKQKGVGDNPK